MAPILVLLRPHQWIKNLFVAAPLFFTPAALSLAAAGRVALGIACFSALASSMYVLNDWCDREADRLHPKKRARPLAAGTVSTGAALLLGLGLAVTGFAGAALALRPGAGRLCRAQSRLFLPAEADRHPGRDGDRDRLRAQDLCWRLLD